MQLQNVFIHHVFFWLKRPDNQGDRQQLIDGLKKLSAATTIGNFHIGQPAATHREVIERGYSVSWMITFATAAEQDSYQTDPLHLKFVEECAHLWTKVVVFDSIDV